MVKALHKIFSLHGFCKLIKTDGGTSIWNRFTRIMDDLGIIHKKGSAHNHQSQGQVEQTIQAIKTLFARLNKQARSTSRVMSLNTVQRRDSVSVSQMFFGRDIRVTKFWQMNQEVDVPKLAECRKESQRKMRDRTGSNRKIVQFFPGDRVYIQNMKSKLFNIEAMVMEARYDGQEHPRSYYLKTDNYQ